jgi:hypothetical protein
MYWTFKKRTCDVCGKTYELEHGDFIYTDNYCSECLRRFRNPDMTMPMVSECKKRLEVD